MQSLWFIVPAHGRFDLARACLRQLARTCSTLAEHGLHASAVVIAADANIDTALELGFATVERENAPLGRKWNDGYELAGLAGVDYVIPFGTDDWIDAGLVLTDLPGEQEIRCQRLCGIVREDGLKLCPLRITYKGGVGVRTFPTAMLKPLRYRPADDDARRAIDTSIFQNLRLSRGFEIRYVDMHPFQIIDWKSREGQLNGYQPCRKYQDGPEVDPWTTLAGYYPAEALDEIRPLFLDVPEWDDDTRTPRQRQLDRSAAARAARRQTAIT